MQTGNFYSLSSVIYSYEIMLQRPWMDLIYLNLQYICTFITLLNYFVFNVIYPLHISLHYTCLIKL